MPCFDYACTFCRHVERDVLVQSIEEYVHCPKCMAPGMARLFSPRVSILTSAAGRMALQEVGRHSQWLEDNQDEINAKLMSGEYSLEKKETVIERAAAGI